MDKEELKKMYRQKLDELETEREKLGDMFAVRVGEGAALTDAEIVHQNEHCGEIGMEVSRLREMLKEEDD